MRRIDVALTTLALRTSAAQPPKAERRLVPAVDDPDLLSLNRGATPLQRAAMIASLWPAPTRQCVAGPVFAQLPAPAIFGVVFRVSWPALPSEDARALQARLNAAFMPQG